MEKYNIIKTIVIPNYCTSCDKPGCLASNGGGGSGGPDGTVGTCITNYTCKNCGQRYDLTTKNMLGKGTMLEVKWEHK